MKASAQPGREDAVVPCRNVNKSLNGTSSTNKPLHNCKFYLDVKNRITASKLELKIKELGGALELFLVKEITHVITDREGCCSVKGGGSQPRTPQYVPHELANNEIGTHNEDNTPKRGRPKTRADAMLERARKTPTVVTKDPLDEARNWGITIWSIDKTLAFLEQVAISYKLANKRKTQKFFELKSPCIKFEAFNRQSRPIFQEIRNWPQLNFQGSAGDPGIIIRSTVERNMTRKTRSNPRLDTALQPGYCEVCRADYLRLDEHLESDKHISFIKDSSNFLQLDTLISNTSNINNFLKLNGVDKFGDLDPLKNKRRMLRPRTVSLCDRIRNSPLSPTGSEAGHRLRSKRHSAVNNYVGALIDEEVKTEVVRERELRSSTRQLLKLLENEQKDTWDSGRPKRSCIKQKRLSVDEHIPIENKMYYKVEMLSNKLRSSDTAPKEQDVTKKTSNSKPDNNSDASSKNKSLIVKFKKMRSYELRQLNNEAENFLFPKKDDSSSEDDVDADNPNTTASVGEGDSTILLSSESESLTPKTEEVKHLDEASLDSNWSECSTKKKKRRTHAEAFILDNQKYYKFETPGSRLRYHGSYLPPITTNDSPKLPKSPKRNGEHLSKIVKLDEKIEIMEVKDQPFILKNLEFSFERVPCNESWYETFKRQDEGQEYYTFFNDSDYRKPFLLPYQMGPLPALDPRLCIKTYQELKKELQAHSTSTSAGSNTPVHTAENQLDLNEDNSKASEDSSSTNDARLEDDLNLDELLKNKSANKSKRVVLCGKNPRKSPRQHASTLAILSSLIYQRKRRSDNKSSSELDKTLPTISEKEEMAEKRETTVRKSTVVEDKEDELEVEIQAMVAEHEEIAKKINEEWCVLSEMERLDIKVEEAPLINRNVKLSAIELLNDYDSRGRIRSKNPIKKLFPIAKKPGRKKKKNRTGWPNKNSRRKREGTVKDEEFDDKSMDSFSVINLTLDDDMVDGVFNNGNRLKKTEHTKGDQSTKGVPVNVNSATLQTQEIVLNGDEDRVLENCDKDNSDKTSSDELDRVVDLDKWETAEKVLSAKVTNSGEVKGDKNLQPVVRVQKLTSNITDISSKKRARGSLSPHRTFKRPRRTPPSPKSPRILRRPRGRWYRER